MFEIPFFIKLRLHIAIAIFAISFIPALILRAIYQLFAGFIRPRKFKSIEGNVAVVTGGGHGLGRCIAVELGRRGCHVAVVDINLKGAEETVRIVSSQFEGKCKAYQVDVTNYEEIVQLNERISKDLGVATIVINNAGILTLSNIARPPIAEIQRMINVNLTSHFLMNQVFLENMKKKRKGHIVAISSLSSLFPIVYCSAYCATKFGIRGMMRALRIDLAANDFGDIHTTLAMPFFLSTNEEVVDYVQKNSIPNIYPMISGEDAAQQIVHAMLRNEVEIVIPKIFGTSCNIFNFLPPDWQDKLQQIVSKPYTREMQNIYNQHLEEITKK